MYRRIYFQFFRKSSRRRSEFWEEYMRKKATVKKEKTKEFNLFGLHDDN
ncbi:hypothetical protein [Candidatus Cardinium hertigii]|nr:hypothetical protein [Candidatus Cardinium hertigii]